MHFFSLTENFAKSEYYRLALEELNNNSTAMASLGAPPLKIHNIHLSDRHNRMDHNSAQVSILTLDSYDGLTFLYSTSEYSKKCVYCQYLLNMYMFAAGQHYFNPHLYKFQLKIPVTGSNTGGYLYTSSTRDTLMNR